MKLSKVSIAAIASLYILSSCGNTPEQDGLGHHHDHGHEKEHVDHDHSEHAGEHGEHNNPYANEHGHEHPAAQGTEIMLDDKTAEKMGVKAEVASPSTFHEVLKVSGQIIPSPSERQVVSATSSGILRLSGGITEGSNVRAGQLIGSISSKGIAGGDPNAVSKAVVTATKRELDRLTPLHKEGIVSTREYNAAIAAYEQARASHSGSPSGGSAVAPRSGVITQLFAQQGQYVNSGQPIAEISGSQQLTLRADVPSRNYRFLSSITSANFQTTYSDEVISISELGGRLQSNGQTGSTSGAYSPVYFSLRNNGNIAPGTYATVFLLGATRDNVLSAPVEAISEQQGNYYIFVKLDHGCYDKRQVTLGAGDGSRVEILSGLKAGENVVVKGVTAVKLAETSGVVPEGHSHSH